jgi:hypothetical protein
LDAKKTQGLYVNIPQSTIEKPLTTIDFIAAMNEQCSSLHDLTMFASRCPLHVLEDDRFARAFKSRLDTIRRKR